MNIAEIVRERAAREGELPAIIDRDGTVTFRELDERAARIAARLRAIGVVPGDRALVMHPIAAPLYAWLIALFRLGATVVVLDPSAGRAHLDRCCRLAAPRLFIGTPRAHVLRIMSGGVRRIPLRVVAAAGNGAGGEASLASRLIPGVRARISAKASNSATAAGHRDTRIEPCDEQMAALLTFTSGSTGQPKAVVRTHGFLLAQHRVIDASFQLRAGMRDLTALPIFVLSNLASGVASIIPDADLRRPGAIDAAPVCRQIARHAPHTLTASPALLERIVSHARASGQSLDSFTHIFTGGAPVLPRLLRSLREVAPRAVITAVYGSTEAEPIAEIDLHDISQDDFARMRNGAGLLTGRPVEAIDLRIIADHWGTPLGPFDDAALDQVTLPAGSIGEIVVAGPHVLAGYLDGVGDEETKMRVMTRGAGTRIWHRTGDAGYLDAHGRLWLMGRCSAKIQDAAGTVYPFAVECGAQEIDGVRRAALVARNGGRVLVVEIEPAAMSASASGAVAATLRQELAAANLADIAIVPEIPVDSRHNAKIDYPALHKLLARR